MEIKNDDTQQHSSEFDRRAGSRRLRFSTGAPAKKTGGMMTDNAGNDAHARSTRMQVAGVRATDPARATGAADGGGDAKASGDWSIIIPATTAASNGRTKASRYLWSKDQKPGDMTGDGFNGVARRQGLTPNSTRRCVGRTYGGFLVRGSVAARLAAAFFGFSVAFHRVPGDLVVQAGLPLTIFTGSRHRLSAEAARSAPLTWFA
jgi:hypothetical protein